MDFNEGRAIYLQIADYMINNILSGVWKETERIPSVRELSVQMQVNPNTAMRTFAYLQDQDVLFNKRGIGYFVAAGAYKRAKDLKKEDFLSNIVPDFFKTAKLLDLSEKDIVNLYHKH
ncbi:MAG: GntR family transcriptional regulator [Bacteroidetes bacterium]|jgi:DNA-binding transcriptional regulator YhcF (GntR family)|nr:GntR family transcriptional regulator [Bacteroidota bacterium]